MGVCWFLKCLIRFDCVESLSHLGTELLLSEMPQVSLSELRNDDAMALQPSVHLQRIDNGPADGSSVLPQEACSNVCFLFQTSLHLVFVQ